MEENTMKTVKEIVKRERQKGRRRVGIMIVLIALCATAIFFGTKAYHNYKEEEFFKSVKEKEIKVIYAVTILLFAAFLAVPIIRLLGESFVLDTGWGMENYTSVLTGKGFAEAFGNSIVISLTSAVISTVLAFFLAYSIQYTNLGAKYKKLIRLLAVLPMLLPTITYGFAIIYSFGKQGLLTKLIGCLLNTSDAADEL